MHMKLITRGFSYLFGAGPQYKSQDVAKRAELLLFQTYPANSVQGAGTLTAQNGRPGKYFSVLQPPQVVQGQNAIDAAILGGGTLHGNFDLQPLIDTSTGV